MTHFEVWSTDNYFLPERVTSVVSHPGVLCVVTPCCRHVSNVTLWNVHTHIHTSCHVTNLKEHSMCHYTPLVLACIPSLRGHYIEIPLKLCSRFQTFQIQGALPSAPSATQQLLLHQQFCNTILCSRALRYHFTYLSLIIGVYCRARSQFTT